ncbi:MAG: hypothetical protein GY752_11925 [bacterium]|nr:hypothetical protein [bacterium]MCP4799742.1 hypothetical protein [bacterium]
MKLTVTILILLIASAAFPQAMDIEFDLNTPTYDTFYSDNQLNYSKSQNISLSFGIFTYNWQQENIKSRKGLVFHRQSVTMKSITENPYSSSYQAHNLRFCYQRKMIEFKSADLIAGLGTGFSAISKENQTEGEGPFSNMPDFTWHVTPDLKMIVPLGARISVVFGAKAVLLLGDKEATFPFKSGIMFSVGIELNGGREFKKPKTHL